MFLAELTCARCGARVSQTVINGAVYDPAGWSVVTVDARPVVNRRLCVRCAAELRAWLDTPPGVAEAQRDHEREKAFRAGYDDGAADALHSHVALVHEATQARCCAARHDQGLVCTRPVEHDGKHWAQTEPSTLPVLIWDAS